MTTPHAPEGGEVAALRAIVLRALDGYRDRRRYSDPPAVFGDTVDALITAAATAERARLAGMASEEDRAMVSNFGAVHIRCGIANAMQRPDTRELADKCDESAATLLARLAAARGERDEAIRQLGVALGRIAAAERAGAERALRWAWRNEGAVCTEPEDELLRLALATLFPPPGAEVGRG